MSVSDARQSLVRLEEAEAAQAARELSEQQRFNEALAAISQIQAERQKRRHEIAKARDELSQQEKIEAAQQRVSAIANEADRLSAQFEQIALDKPWYLGTRTDENGDYLDPILSHQWAGMQFGAAAKRWILGDGVGLGKTRTTVGWLDLVEARRVVIVCEANIAGQFAGEVATLAPHRTLYNLYHRKAAKGSTWPVTRSAIIDEILTKDEAVVVVNFEIWRKDRSILQRLISWGIDTLVVDEAHNLKNTSTTNFKNIKELCMMDNTCPRCGNAMAGLYSPEGLAQVPPRKVPVPCDSCQWKIGDNSGNTYVDKFDLFMSTRSVKNVCFTTGTPILNDPGDLFSLLYLINPLLFPSKKGFEREFLIMNYYTGKWEWRSGMLDRLKPLVDGFFVARTLEDAGVVLPEQHVNIIPVDLRKEEYPLQMRTIQQISDRAMIQLSSGEQHTIMHVMALLTRKRQANVWPGGITIKDDEGNVVFSVGDEVRESVKMDEIEDSIMRHIELGHHKQIVFSQFKTGIAELAMRLANRGLSVARMDGDTTPGERESIKADFDRRTDMGKYDVVLANYKTGGTGLNFTAATVTHVMDEEWNPGKRNQGYGRTRRIGQTDETLVYVYRIPKSVDTWMANTISRKERLIQGFNETVSGPDDIGRSLLEAMTTGEML